MIDSSFLDRLEEKIKGVAARIASTRAQLNEPNPANEQQSQEPVATLQEMETIVEELQPALQDMRRQLNRAHEKEEELAGAQADAIVHAADIIEQLEDVKAELERSNRELEQFAFIVSHDLKAPLRHVIGFCQLLQKQYHGQFDEKADEWHAVTVESTQQMQTLIDDLLAYSRLHKQEAPEEPTDLAVTFEQAIANLQTAIGEACAVVTCDSLPTLPVNTTQMVQLFQNLIDNAVKFRADRPPQVHLGAEQVGSEWLFSVRDNGIGIPAEHTRKIFEMFRRLHTQDKYPGTGVGLAICNKIVELHGGKLWIESKPGEGSVFYFTIQAPVGSKPEA